MFVFVFCVHSLKCERRVFVVRRLLYSMLWCFHDGENSDNVCLHKEAHDTLTFLVDWLHRQGLIVWEREKEERERRKKRKGNCRRERERERGREGEGGEN